MVAALPQFWLWHGRCRCSAQLCPQPCDGTAAGFRLTAPSDPLLYVSCTCNTQVCTEVAARWLPLQPELYLGSPAGDLEALSTDDFQAAAAEQPAKLRPLLEALLPLWRLQLDNAAELAPGGKGHKRSKGSASAAAGGPFRAAAARPPPPEPATLSDAALQQEARRLLQQLQRAKPAQRKREREARTAAAFEQADGGSGWAAAEARARRHRQPV